MLAVKKFNPKYIDECREKVEQLVTNYERMVEVTGRHSAIDSFENDFFRHMVLALDNYFANRMRGQEGKDGNPLNEVRMLCESITNNKGIMMENKTIKYDPEKSVLKIKIGDEIKINKDGFAKLAKGFFDEMGRKFA